MVSLVSYSHFFFVLKYIRNFFNIVLKFVDLSEMFVKVEDTDALNVESKETDGRSAAQSSIPTWSILSSTCD